MSNMIPQIKGLSEYIKKQYNNVLSILGLANISFETVDLSIEKDKYAEIQIDNPYEKHIKVLVKETNEESEYQYSENPVKVSVTYNNNCIRIYNEYPENIDVKVTYKKGDIFSSSLFKDVYSMVPGDRYINLLDDENIIPSLLDNTYTIEYTALANGYINVEAVLKDEAENIGIVEIFDSVNTMRNNTYLNNKTVNSAIIFPVAKNHRIIIAYSDNVVLEKTTFVQIKS